MSGTHAPARDDRQQSRRQQRKNGTVAARTPEPKDIVSGAGQPLDPGVRRELEERLGHDFSRVRLHNDRDSAALAELVGADAVTVGEDIFFAEGKFRPGTADGQRLLAHELLHTVQAPHSLGALRAGRDLGAVSLPQDAIEREAEHGARSPEQRPEVSRQATPGWLRYATVDADRLRTEKLDPATLVDRLTAGILRSLRGDPTDASGRVRLQLARFSPELQDSVLDRLEQRLPSADHERLLELVEQVEESPYPLESAPAPAPVVDTADRMEAERESARTKKDSDREHEDQVAEDRKRERGPKDPKDTPEQGAPTPDQPGRSAPEATGDERSQQPDKGGQEPAGQGGSASGAAGSGGAAPAAAPTQRQAQQTGAEPQQAQPAGQAGQAGLAGQAEKDAPAAREQETAAEKPPAAEEDKKEKAAEEPGGAKGAEKEKKRKPAEGSKEKTTDKKAVEQPQDVRADKVDEAARAPDSPLVAHGLDKPDEGDPREEEQPLGVEADADRDVNPEAAGEKQAAAAAGADLQPEDFLPSSDLDVSAVPTADQLKLPADGSAPASAEAPDFPAPPVTKAEQVMEERANAEEDAAEENDESAPEPQSASGGPTPAEGTPGGPVAQAGGQAEQDLQSGQSAEQEVGPDPETDGRNAPEPESDPERDPQEQQDAAVAGPQAAEVAGDKDDDDRTDSEAEEKRAKDEEDAKEETPAPSVRKPVTATAAAPASAVRAPAGASTPAVDSKDRTPSPAVRRAGATARGGAGRVGGGSDIGPVAVADSALDMAPGAPGAAEPVVGPVEQQTEEPGTTGAPAQDSSMEPGGGVCAPPEPAAEKEGGGGGCGGGGGGGAATKEQKETPPPDVSGQDPQSALSTVSTLPPDQMETTLDGVDGAAEKRVGEAHDELAGSPPTMTRPAGAPQTLSGEPKVADPAEPVTEKVERVGKEGEGDQKKADDDKKAEGAKPTEAVNRPTVAGTPEGEVTADDVDNIQAAVDQVPDSDPALNQTVGPAPKVELTGDSDPKRTDEQAKNLDKTKTEIVTVGHEDVAKPMGEDQVYPDVPPEQLSGKVPGGGGGGAGRKTAGRSIRKPGVGIVAKQERGGQVQASVGQAQGGMTTAEADHKASEQQEKQNQQAKIDEAEAQNAQQQAGERQGLQVKVVQARTDWQSEQDKKITDADKDATEEHDSRNKDIQKKRTDTDKDVESRKDDDNQGIRDEKDKAEQDAKKEKESKKEDSGGFWGWVKSKVASFFEGLLKAVTAIFDAARKAVNGIIEGFRKFANDLIDAARDFAVGLINKLADALIAIGDVLLAAFPELRDKFRKAINDMRDAAIAAVNKLADGLKAAVNAVLDALAAGLNALLNVLEAAYKAAINIVRSAVMAAIEFAEKAIAAFGQFAALIADIAPDPGGWLSKLGSSAKEGVTDHLWGAIKTGVKQWFDAKVEGLLGLGKMIFNVLIKGCMSMKQIGKMAWNAIIAALPMMIISIVIEKLISVLVPAAGAILTIIQGLMAAWQTISKVLAAFGKFFAFLKAVKAGPAACLFAEAVAAGVVALLDFITNFLISRLRGPMKTVGNNLKKIAKTIGKGLKKAGKALRKGAGKAVNNARTSLRNAKQALAKPPRPAVAKGPKVPSKPSKPASRHPDGAAKSDHKTDQKPEKPTTHQPDPKSREPKPEPAGPTPSKTAKPAKPAKPKKPISAAGRALKGAKKAVKSALKKVRNAGRALGKKLRNSKLGQALSRSAKKMRDAFKRKRDQLKNRLQQRRNDRRRKQEDRRKKENSPEAKEVRLQRIVARIKPRIERLLRRGVTGVAMDLTLNAMRLWYRLTSLSRQGDPNFDVLARLNPALLAGGGFRLTGEDLRNIVHEIAEEILRRPEIMDSARRMRITKEVSEDHPLEASESRDIPGAVRYLRERGTKLGISTPRGNRDLAPQRPVTGIMERYRLWRDRDEVKEQKKRGATNAITQGVDAYPRIADALAATGVRGEVLAGALEQYNKSGRFPRRFTAEQKKLLRDLHWLMFVRESVRNPGNLGFAAMTTALVSRGPDMQGLTWDEVFSEYEGADRRPESRTAVGGRGRFPMSMEGAARAARGLARRVIGRPGKARDTREELRRREIEIAQQWVFAATGKMDVLGKTEADAIDEGRRLVRTFMLQFYGLD